MKIGEIKLETLRMIYPAEVFNVIDENLDEALGILKASPNFADYLANMPGIMNRCFGLLEQRGILPTKQAELTLAQGEYLGPYIRYSLNEKIADYRAVEKVIYTDGKDYDDMCDFKRESELCVLVPWKSRGRYIFVYVPRIPRVTANSAESTCVLTGRDDIASLIPYFIKSELLITEQPDDAQAARALFEAGLNELVTHRESYQGTVEARYSIGN